MYLQNRDKEGRSRYASPHLQLLGALQLLLVTLHGVRVVGEGHVHGAEVSVGLTFPLDVTHFLPDRQLLRGEIGSDIGRQKGKYSESYYTLKHNEKEKKRVLFIHDYPWFIYNSFPDILRYPKLNVLHLTSYS